MKYSKLGNTDIDVSKICLGTMTWGEQNTQDEAFEQMDYALEKGVNFFDAAEMYPVPPKAETQGATEEIIGNWFEKTGNRDKVILASKVTGRSEGFKHVRGGEVPRFDYDNIEYALHESLKRLKTDYIDLYQLHWPDRSTNYFGELGYKHKEDEDFIAFRETFEVLNKFAKQGKIRHVGLSNESPWGVLDALRQHEKMDYPRVMSVQNPYSLLNRTYEIGLAEISIREECGLLAYSPLAFGVLSGKYIDGKKPEGARLTLFDRFQRYNTEKANIAVKKYKAVADEAGLSLTQMSLAYINQQRFVTSNIIGATTMDQLQENIDSINVELSDEVLKKIEEIHKEMPNPCP